LRFIVREHIEASGVQERTMVVDLRRTADWLSVV